MPYIKGLWANASGNAGLLAATTTSNPVSAGDVKQTILTLDVFDGGSWVPGSGTIKVKARLMGAGQNDAAATTFSVANLSYQDRTATSGTAGSTGINAVGLYSFDVTGLEFAVVYTRGTDTGTVGIRGDLTAVGA